jgi:hypothetical protein
MEQGRGGWSGAKREPASVLIRLRVPSGQGQQALQPYCESVGNRLSIACEWGVRSVPGKRRG